VLRRCKGAEVFVNAGALTVRAGALGNGGGAAHEQLKVMSTIATAVFIDWHNDPSWIAVVKIPIDSTSTTMISAIHFIAKYPSMQTELILKLYNEASDP
jgi:hypothetical protein